MRIGNFELYSKVMIIAEIGNNHEGSYALAEEIIGRAAEAGADAVKFQTFRAELLVGCTNKARYEQLKSFELTFNEFEKLSQVAKNAGVIFLSTPFDLESAEFLNNIMPAFKISSGDNNFYPLIEKVAGFGKPIILSSGLADMTQLKHTKTLIEKVWSNLDVDPGFAILHCVSSYPAEPAQANLNAICHLGKELGCTVGYSDHTIGIEAAVLSVALGARIVEKHFTIDKNYSDFHDHQLSADYHDMQELVRRVSDTLGFMGTGQKMIQDCEKKAVSLLRRSIAARQNLVKGTVITQNDICWTRPGGGIAPGREMEILGKVLGRSVQKGDMILLEDVGLV